MDLLTTYVRLGTKSNYSATANLHSSQITTAPDKTFQPAVSSPAVPWQCLLTVEILFSFTPSGPIFTASHAKLNSQLTWLPQFSFL
jgi:hypothetical protein